MMNWEDIIDAAEHYEIHPLDSTDKYLDELRELVPVPVQIWTYSWGRGWQYEFELVNANPSHSLLVEISNVVPVAFVYFAERWTHEDGEIVDQCGDCAFIAGQEGLRIAIVDRLKEIGFAIIPYEEHDVVRRGKETHYWLICDPEE